MSNLSLTACSFHFRKMYSHGNDHVFDLNYPVLITSMDGEEYEFKNMMSLFNLFFEQYKIVSKNDDRQQSFSCEYNIDNYVDTEEFGMYYVKINSGNYGSSSDIYDGKTDKLLYQKKSSDIDTRPFYLMIVFPKDNDKVTVQKGMFIFQNVGPFGVKTITTEYMRDFFAKKFGITLKCNTIAPDLYVKKIVRKDNIKKLVMIKNMKSTDVADNINVGYGSEVRELSNLCFNDSAWNKIMGLIRHVAGSKYSVYEFENIEYDNLKVVVEIGDRIRRIDLHNIENLSIIEGIPDEIKMNDGHPNLSKLLKYFITVASEYLQEMVLQIN